MHQRIVGRATAILLLLFIAMFSTVSAASISEKRDSTRNMANQTLDRLYSTHPSARAAVENAVGYAVFNVSDVKLVLLGGGGGKGIAINNATGEETFMKTSDVQVGFGLGIKKFQLVFVFESEKAFNNFVAGGWDFGGQATVAATDSVTGDSLQGAVSAGPDAWVYQMTDKGLEASLTIRGIRYYRDSDLN